MVKVSLLFSFYPSRRTSLVTSSMQAILQTGYICIHKPYSNYTRVKRVIGVILVEIYIDKVLWAQKLEESGQALLLFTD